MPKRSRGRGLPRGVVTALITPFNVKKGVDVDALRALVEFQLRNGVSGFFILGTYGEGLSIHPSARKAFAERVAEYVGSKVPVINCVSTTSLELSLELARHSADIGLRYIALLPPIYYRAGLGEMLRYYSAFEGLGLDIIVYNIPSKAGVDVTPSMFRQIASGVESVVGVKDSTGSIERILDLTEDFRGDYYIAIASDSTILEAFLYGADSHICGICNAVPELSNMLYNSIASGDLEKATRYKRMLWRLRRLAREFSVEGVSLVKALLRIRGIDVGESLPPNRALDEKELSRAREALESVLREAYIELRL